MRNLRKYMSVLLVVAMMVSCIVPATAATTATASSFQYENEAQTLHDLGLFNGTSEKPGEFVPDLGKTLDRQTGVVLLVRLLGLEKEALKMKAADVNAALGKFPDSSSVADWAKNDFAYAVDNKLVKGVEEGGKAYLKPIMALSGKMYATMILRQLGYTDGEAGKGDFKYDDAVTSFSRISKVSEKQFSSLANKTMTRDDLVGMSFTSLSANFKGEKSTIVSKLVESGVLTAEQVKVAKEKVPQGFSEEVKPGATTPGTTPTVATSISKVTFANELVETDATKAKAVATFGTFPAADPVDADFSVIEDVYVGSTATRVSVTGSVYALDKASKSVVLAVPSVSAAGTTKVVKIYVSYKGEPYVQAADYSASQSGISVTGVMAAGTSVAKGQALVEVGKLTLKTSNSNMTVSGVNLKRTGLSSDTDIDNVTVWDGNKKLNVGAIFSNGVAKITFTSPVEVKANEDKVLTVKMNIKSDAGVSTQITVGVTDVIAPSGVAVSGSFPMNSGMFMVANVTLGTLTVTRSADEPTANVDAGSKEIRLAKFDFAAATENQTVKIVTFTQNGSAADSDFGDLKLYDGSTLLATSKLSDRKVTFEFSKDVNAGATLRLTLKGDLLSGASRKVRFDVADVNDVQGIGKDHQTTIVASFNAGATSLTGVELTINDGGFLFSRASSSPAAGTISQTVNDFKFATFKVETVGEVIQVRKLRIKLTPAGGASATDITDLKLKNGDVGLAQIQTPFTTSTANTAQAIEVTLSTPLDISPSTPAEISVLGDFTSSATDETYTFGLDGDNSVTTASGVGKTSGKTINTIASAAINGNTMTVGSLNVTFTRVPTIDENVFQNQAAKKLIEFDITHGLSESVDISTIVVSLGDKDDNNTKKVSENFANAKLVNSAGEVISDVVTSLPTTKEGNISFSLKNPLTVATSQTVRIGVVADISSNANSGDNYYFGITTSTVARTTDTGTTATTAAVTENAGKLVTISSGGAVVTASRSANAKLDNDNVYAGDKNVKVGAFALMSSATGVEDATISKLRLTPMTGAQLGSGVAEVSKITISGTATGVATITVTLDNNKGGTLTVTDDSANAESASTLATNLTAAINANAVAKTLYSAAADAGVVTITRRNAKQLTDATVALSNATSGFTATAATTTQGANPTTGTNEIQTFTITTPGADDVIALTLPDNQGGTTVSASVTLDATSAASVTAAATALAAAINADADASVLYSATSSVGVVSVTRRDKGNIDQGTSAETDNSGGAATACADATSTAGVAPSDLNTFLDAQYVSNIRITSVDGTKLYATVSSLPESREINLSQNIVVPNVNASTNSGDRTVDVVVLADISDNAPYGKIYAVRLGDTSSTTSDLVYKAVGTGTDGTSVKDIFVESGPSTADAVFTTGGAKLTVASVVPANTAPKVVDGGEIGKFSITNNSTSRNVMLNKLLISSGSSTAAVKIYKTSNNSLVGSGSLSSTGAITLSSPVQINKGETKEFSVKVDTGAAVNWNLSVNQGNTTDGSVYTVVGDSGATSMTIDDTVGLTQVIMHD